MKLPDFLNTPMTFIWMIGIAYALITSNISKKEFDNFRNSFIQISQGDTVAFMVKLEPSYPGMRMSAVSAPILTECKKKVWLMAEVNYNYDPSKSGIGEAIEPGDSIFFPFNKDTILLKKQNDEKYYYQIIYPEPKE